MDKPEAPSRHWPWSQYVKGLAAKRKPAFNWSSDHVQFWAMQLLTFTTACWPLE